MQKFSFFLFLSFLFKSFALFSYPDFISYGYKTCMTCHFTGSGGGALNEYGKGVFASEMTARSFTSKTSEQLSETSGFTAGYGELPYWFSPGVKYRGLWFRRNPFESIKKDRSFSMQFDIDLNFIFDKKQKYVLVTSLAYVPTPTRFKTSTDPDPANAIFRQFYLRWGITKGLYLYTGIFDKFFGIKHADHTAVNRGDMGLGMSDQTHGMALQYSAEKYDIAGHVFVGNLNQEKDIRQKGFTLTSEYYLEQLFTLGASFLNSSSDFKKEQRVALFSRVGFSKGKSMFIESGYRQDESKTGTPASEKGIYTYLQSLIDLKQGYNFLTTYQYKRPNISSSQSAEINKLGVGFLMFPLQRTEVRTELVNTRTTAAENSSPDEWSFLGQVHVSW